MTSGRSTCDGLDRPTLARYIVQMTPTKDLSYSKIHLGRNDLGNRNSVNPPRRGDNVDDAIDNLTNRYDSSGEIMTKTVIRLLKELAQS